METNEKKDICDWAYHKMKPKEPEPVKPVKEKRKFYSMYDTNSWDHKHKNKRRSY